MSHHRFVQVLFSLVFFISALFYTPSIANSQESPAFVKGDFAIINAKDSPISLWDAPDALGVADVIRVGTVVQIDEVADGNALHPYFVHSVTDPTRHGWISGDVLKSVEDVQNHIGNVITCSEAAHRLPICGTTIPLTKRDSLMLHFDYYGVAKNAYLQWVITVGSEQYSSRLMKLERTEGANVFNLLDMETPPHRFAGQWQITLYINGQSVHERGMTILSTPAPLPTLPPTSTPTHTPIPTATPAVPRPWDSQTIHFRATEQ
jgi:hypothetical protein